MRGVSSRIHCNVKYSCNLSYQRLKFFRVHKVKLHYKIVKVFVARVNMSFL